MVPQIKKILFPTDLSQASRNAYGYAVAVAQKFEAAIAILHVMDDAADEGSAALQDFLGEQRWRQLQKGHEQDAREILIGKQREGALIREALGAFAESTGQMLGETGVNMDEIIVVRGNVVEEIISESTGRNCDLIIMGYVARGKIEEAILGSTSRRVLRSSNIPVMLVKAPEQELKR
jgi:nucleotide-binding universal stress UspA family protein